MFLFVIFNASAVHVSFLGSGCVARKYNSERRQNSDLREMSEKDVFDASREDELLGEQKQWRPLLELCFHYSVGRVLEEALGVDSAMVRNVHVCTIHRTRGTRVLGQVFVVIKTIKW